MNRGSSRSRRVWMRRLARLRRVQRLRLGQAGGVWDAFVAWFATAVTLNTGASGGVFTPALYVGAASGGAFGVGLAALFPELGLSPEAYALVGMGAVVAAATDAPLTGILIVFEMTNDYAIMLPLMLTTVIAYVVARRIEPDSLYSGWLRRRGQTIAHGADLGLLARIPVADAYNRDPQVIHEASNVAKIFGQRIPAARRAVNHRVPDPPPSSTRAAS